MKSGKIVLYVIYLAAVSLFLLELAVRIWGYSERYIYDPIYIPFPQCQDIPYIHKPCLQKARARGLAVINTDSLGLRALKTCADYGAKGHDELRIAITGDSVTFGEGIISTECTYPALLGKILREHTICDKILVFNYGVSAYSVKQMAATASCRMPEVEPDIMIMAVIPEDFNLERTGTVDKWGYTVHASGTGIAGRDSLLKKFLRKIHLTYLIRDIYYSYRVTKQDNMYQGIPHSYIYVKKFCEAAEKNGSKALVLLLPSQGHRFSREFKLQMQHDGTTFLDLYGIVHQFAAKDYTASRFDPHPSAAVHKIIAEDTAAFIMQHFAILHQHTGQVRGPEPASDL